MFDVKIVLLISVVNMLFLLSEIAFNIIGTALP